MRALKAIGLVVALAILGGAAARATQSRFVAGGIYRGATSQQRKVRIQVSRSGMTARVDAGMLATCSGAGRYTFYFMARFHRNPARIVGGVMSVNEVDHHVPRIRRIPAAKVLKQSFTAHATGTGRTLSGTYREQATLEDGRHCSTGTVSFTAKLSK